MDKKCIFASEALRKLKLSQSLNCAAYLFGGTGYGKTLLVRQFIGNAPSVWLSPEDDWDLMIPVETGNVTTFVVIDDLQSIHDVEKLSFISSLFDREDLSLILIGRMPVPEYLLPYVSLGKLVVIGESDLHLNEKDVSLMLKAEGLEFSTERISEIVRNTEGNAYCISSFIQLVKSGFTQDADLGEHIRKLFMDHLEVHVFSQFSRELQSFLMQVSVVESFTLPLAVMITGDDQSLRLLDDAFHIGNFLSLKDGVYTIRPVFRQALLNIAFKGLGMDAVRNCRSNAALYHETHGDVVKALEIYEENGDKERIRALLIRNGRRHFGDGNFYELKRYYLALKDEEATDCPVLMSTLSMLHSVRMNIKESERWYDKLKEFAGRTTGGDRREADEFLLYLDIALPHRGTVDMIDAVKRTSRLMVTGGVRLPEFSLTNNQPSAMNGGKDFCSWSRKDRLLAGTIGKFVEKVLGNFGKGVVDIALCESLYEKGGHDDEVLQHAMLVQLSVDAGGKLELAFAAVGTNIRLCVLTGNMKNAYILLDSFEKRVKMEGCSNLLPSIGTLRCRLNLISGDMDSVDEWLDNAPDEFADFWTLNRYHYMTKVFCYLQKGMDPEALNLLERLRYYSDLYDRPYIRMGSKILQSIALRRENMPWKETFLQALEEAQSFSFVRIISEKGAGVLPLLREIRKDYEATSGADVKWFQTVLDETNDVSKRYPQYLASNILHVSDFPPQALRILQMQADGFSIKEIAKELNMTERNAKYHAAENYHKLGAKGKTDAVQKARILKLV